MDETALLHHTRIEHVRFGQSGVPELYGAACSCGWESESVWSDPEAAENDAANHERRSL